MPLLISKTTYSPEAYKRPLISRIIHFVWRQQSNAAVKPGQPGSIQTVFQVTPPTSVSSKNNAGEFYELNAFHLNGNLGTQLRLPKIFSHVNRNKQSTARILHLRHPSGSLINLDEEMAELLKTTFLGFFHEDEGSTPVTQPRTQNCMAYPLITEQACPGRP